METLKDPMVKKAKQTRLGFLKVKLDEGVADSFDLAEFLELNELLDENSVNEVEDYSQEQTRLGDDELQSLYIN